MSAGAGCYSSARASGGRVWHAARHAQRLARDARLLELGDVDPAAVLALLESLAQPTRDGPDHKLRIDACADSPRGVRLAGTASPIGDEPATWTGVTARIAHPGFHPTSGAKRCERSLFEAAFHAARDAGADEALLFDAADRLVEGSRSNTIVVRADGTVVTPPLTCGAQAGVARGLLLERVPLLRETPVSRAELADAREILAINAVRGVRAIVALDEGRVGSGEAGPWAAQLDHAFRRDC